METKTVKYEKAIESEYIKYTRKHYTYCFMNVI